MHFCQASTIVNLIALFFIYLSPTNKIPLYGTQPCRIGGIFVIKHLIITLVSGSLIGWLSGIDPLWHAILYGTLSQFIIGQVLHIVLKVKTMLLYKLGLSQKPDGTGRLAVPILKP